MIVPSFQQFGGRHAESAALANLLAYHGVVEPKSGLPLSEPLVFGIAGGIGAGYSFCPSIPRHGMGSGVSAVGRHRSYCTGGQWEKDCLDRLGIKSRTTETAAAGKAAKNLQDELAVGRPAIVWCSRIALPFLGMPKATCNQWMHTFLVYGFDEAKNIVYGSECPPQGVTLAPLDLANARAGVCSHKHRTLSLDLDKPQQNKLEVGKPLSAAVLKKAILSGIEASAKELLAGKMKTFSLPGLETLAKMMVSDTNKDGWLKVFAGGRMYWSLRDLYVSIETIGTGGGLFRLMEADFLTEAADLTGKHALAELAVEYRRLAGLWSELADAALPDKVKPLKQTKQLLQKRLKIYLEKGQRAIKQIGAIDDELDVINKQMLEEFALDQSQTRKLLVELSERVWELHAAETEAARRLAKV